MYLTTLDPFARVTRATVMPLDGVRRDGDVLLRFDVPGIDPESIEVTVDRGVLSVSVKRQEERAENDKFFVRERTMGTFTRRLHLSKNLNSDAVEAAYHNGVLEVRIPVLEQAKPRKVEVRQGDDQQELAA
ncbi:MAG TPA: Hsp20/alpha crystallin family protein [Streptosporangiaceae bacterium]|jgi:HSP20 family protein|nr:Hsp20/alpha crystallin family protein [Streptosporangiaceae bacterium]